MANENSIDSTTLKQRIEAMPEDCILFRSDFPEYHTEFVGSILTELTNDGTLVKIAHGIYTKPRKSRFGIVLPSVDKVVQAIRYDCIEFIRAIDSSTNELYISNYWK